MSLTSIIKQPEVSNKIRSIFTKPKIKVEKKLLAPALTKNYTVVGTAFDYLFRFYLKRLNPEAVTGKWVAEGADCYMLGFFINVDSRRSGVDPNLTDNPTDFFKAQRFNEIISESKEAYQQYLKTGELSKNVLSSVIYLAQLDIIFRTGRSDLVDLKTARKADMEDLKHLVQLIRRDDFIAKDICLLNPTFGEASKLVDGADADVVLDDKLIDIKVTEKFEFTQYYYNQLTGYYCLYKIGHINGLPKDRKINKLGIYFARYGYLYLLKLTD